MGIQEFKGSIFKSVWTKLLAACVEDFFFPFSRRRLERASEQTSSLGRWAKTGEKRVGVSKNGGDLEGRRSGEERDDSFFTLSPPSPCSKFFTVTRSFFPFARFWNWTSTTQSKLVAAMTSNIMVTGLSKYVCRTKRHELIGHILHTNSLKFSTMIFKTLLYKITSMLDKKVLVRVKHFTIVFLTNNTAQQTTVYRSLHRASSNFTKVS